MIDKIFSSEEKNLFLERFHAPAVAGAYLNIIFTEQEIEFVLSMDKKEFTMEDIKDVIQENAEDFVKNAYHRGILSYVDESRNQMKLAGFYERMDVMAVSEQDVYRTIPEEGRKEICKWLFEQYFQGLNPDASVRPTNDVILPLEKVLEFIDSKGSQPVYLNYCDCKSLNGECGKPVRTCITYKTGINTYFSRGLSQAIDRERAKEIVINADKEGLMHTVNPTGICNCCGDCCYLFRSQKRRKSAGFWPEADYIIRHDGEKCVGCGACVKRCWFDVFTKEGGRVTANTEKCVGCGICMAGCPKDALKLVKREINKQ